MMEIMNFFISLTLECMILIYYTNSTMSPRKNYLCANLIIAIGYVALFAISLYNLPTLNVLGFVVINFIIIYMGYSSKLKNVIIQALVLTALMMVAEGMLALIMNVGIYDNAILEMSVSARIIHAISSKMVYFIGIIITKFIAKGKHVQEVAGGYLSLILIPIFTIMSLVGIMAIVEYMNEKERWIFVIIAFFGVLANIIAYWIYDKILKYHKEIEELQEQKYKNNLELTYCNMLEEKLSQARIMRHDFKEHLRILETYIKSDDAQAIEYLKSIYIQNDEISIVNYANNKVLNILLSEKQKICSKQGIEFKIHASDVKLDFMRDIDIVSIFSNLLNNAIESCDKSEKKIIYVNLYKMNESFLVIKIENSCDKKPIEENGFYKTTKISAEEHGIGLKSVVKALKDYNGDLRIQYETADKIFSAMIMIPLK